MPRKKKPDKEKSFDFGKYNFTYSKTPLEKNQNIEGLRIYLIYF